MIVTDDKEFIWTPFYVKCNTNKLIKEIGEYFADRTCDKVTRNNGVYFHNRNDSLQFDSWLENIVQVEVEDVNAKYFKLKNIFDEAKIDLLNQYSNKRDEVDEYLFKLEMLKSIYQPQLDELFVDVVLPKAKVIQQQPITKEFDEVQAEVLAQRLNQSGEKPQTLEQALKGTK